MYPRSHGVRSNGDLLDRSKRTIAELNTDIKTGFATHGFATEELIGYNSILEARLNKKGPNEMPWFMEGNKNSDAKELLSEYASKLGVKHIVQGHQAGKVDFHDGGNKNRKKGALFQRYGILFLIDGGMSSGIDKSAGGALRIIGPASHQQATVICADGFWHQMWDNEKQQDHNGRLCD